MSEHTLFLNTMRTIMGTSSAITHHTNIVTLNRIKIYILEMEDVLFHLNSAVMMPENPEGESSSDSGGGSDDQEKMSGLSALGLVYRQFEFDPDKRMIIAGHTDTSGQPKGNFELSEERAKNILFLLTGEKDEWTKICANRHKVEDYQQIMKFFFINNGIDCDPDKIDDKWGEKTERATKNFLEKTVPDKAESLLAEIKGNRKKKWPEEAWKPIYDLYIEHIYKVLGLTSEKQFKEKRETLKFVNDSMPYVSCGESFPIDSKEKTNYRSQENRRVEILFFDKNEIEAEKIKCPPPGTKVHKADECPLWKKIYFLPLYIDPKDLTSVVYHLKFMYYDRIKDACLPVPEGLYIKAVENGSNTLSSVSTYKNGSYYVKVQYADPINDPSRKSIHFEFEAPGKWIYTKDSGTDPVIVTKTDAEIVDLKKNANFDKWIKHYDLPAKWISCNYRTIYDGKDEGTDTFEDVVHTKLMLKPFGDGITAANKPLSFSLDDIVLLDTTNGSQDIKDESHVIPAQQKNLSNYSRVKILVVDDTTGSLTLYKRDASKPSSSRIPFSRNQIIEKPDAIKKAKVVFFRNGFYPIGHRRTIEENQWKQKGYLVGARAAIKSDQEYCLNIIMKHNDNEFGSTGDYSIHYFHNLHYNNANPVSFLLYYVSISFMADTRENTQAPIPTAAEVKKMVDEGVYDSMDHWNRKRYFYQEETPTNTSLIIRPFYFFDEKETFKVTKPTGGFNIDFDKRANHNALFGHGNLRTAQQNAVGGRSNFLAMICRDTNTGTHWGPAYHWAIRDEGPQHYSLFKLNKSAGKAWPGQYTGVPVNEHSESYGAHTFAHELGHATGHPDEYIKKNGKSYLSRLPDFNQFFVAYSMTTNRTSMMYNNGAPRLHHSWYALHMLNSLIQNTGGVRNLIGNKKFTVRLNRGGVWESVYSRHLDATSATHYQKPKKYTSPMKSDAQYTLSNTPKKRLNIALHDVGRDESSMFNFHAGQTIEYQAVLVVRPLISVDYSGWFYWDDTKRRDKATNLYLAWRNLDGHFRLINGTKDIKNIYITFLPGFSSDTSKANLNYVVDFQKRNYGSGDRIPDSGEKIKVYKDIPASEVVQYMLHTNMALTTAGAIYKLKDWVNTKLGENFTVQYF